MKPWSLVHRGRVEADAVWIDRTLLSQTRAVERVRGLWQAGDRVYEAGQGWLVRFGEPRVFDADGPGLPLVERDGRLVGLPLRDPEWEERPEGAWLGARGGELVAGELGPRVRPGDWLRLDLPVLEVSACAPPPGRARAARPKVTIERGTFGVEAMDPEAQALLQDLLEPVPTVEEEPEAPASEPGWFQRLGGWFTGGSAPPPSAPSRPGPAPGPSSPGWFDGLAAFFDQLFVNQTEAEIRDASRLQAMLARFEGDLEDALRHAIPLTGEGGLHRTHPAWQRMTPRSRLTPSMTGGGGPATVATGAELFDRLQATYRRAAQALVEAGEIEKAAFVYVDLLGDVHAALELLEEHGLYLLAARLAEAREQDPARVARLYVLAGHLGRALTIANTERVFGLLIASFDGKDDLMLRAAYAAHLVGQARFGAATDVLWETQLRSSTRGWLELQLDQAGPDAADALLRLAELDPDAADARFERWLAGEVDPLRLVQLGERMGSEGGWMLDEGPGATQRWARPLVRHLWSLHDTHDLRNAVGGLIGRRALADLRVDAPHLTRPPAGRTQLDVPLGFTGGVPITDIAAVPGGTLCALGEGGLVLLDPRGRPVWRDPTPCTHLVVDEEGFRSIGVHPSGPVHRVLRIDLRVRTVQLWTRVRLVAWSRTSIAGQWLVFDGERPLAIDTSVRDATWRWLWQGPVAEAPVLHVHQDRTGAYIAYGAPVTELWRYDDTWFLRVRERLAGTAHISVAGNEVVTVDGRELYRGRRRVEFVGEVIALLHTPAEPWIAVRNEGRIEVRAALRSDGPWAVLEGCERIGLRMGEGSRVGAYDDLGRVLWLNPASDALSERHQGPWRVV